VFPLQTIALALANVDASSGNRWNLFSFGACQPSEGPKASLGCVVFRWKTSPFQRLFRVGIVWHPGKSCVNLRFGRGPAV